MQNTPIVKYIPKRKQYALYSTTTDGKQLLGFYNTKAQALHYHRILQYTIYR